MLQFLLLFTVSMPLRLLSTDCINKYAIPIFNFLVLLTRHNNFSHSFRAPINRMVTFNDYYKKF